MGTPLRVAQILNRMESGGIESVVMNYYHHMDREKVQFDFYFFEGSAFPQRRELEQLGAGICPVPAYSHPVAYHRALYQAFREQHYSIVHAHLSTMSLFALFAAWRAGVPVRICHNHSTAHWGEGKKTLFKYFLRPLNKLFATHYFACGELAGRWMYGDRCFDRGRVCVMSNAIDMKKFIFDPSARSRLRNELSIPPDAFVVGHVGRFVYPKNHMFLLKVFQQVLARRENAWLLMVGDGELIDEVRMEAGRLGLRERICFAGTRNDAAKLYSAMDVFCLPSFYEGLPVVALEAQANGLPCVFSDRMTDEVLITEDACRLPLGAAGEWADMITGMCRKRGLPLDDEFDITLQAAALERFYIHAVHQ